METLIEAVDKDNIDYAIIQKAAAILRNGGLVAFPTETVYGLGANALSVDAANKIYTAKGRPSDNPLIIHIAKVEDIQTLVSNIPEKAYKLIDKFWPGPLTLVFNKSENVPNTITGGLNTVAIRMPAHKIALEIIEKAKVPVAAPSANLSGRPSPTNGQHVIDDLNGKVDMIIEGGKVDIGLESTVIDVTSEEPLILRPGSITKSMMDQVIGHIEYDQSLFQAYHNSLTPKSPGMKYKHYAPNAQLTVIKGDINKVVEKINGLIAENENQGLKVGVIATHQTENKYVSGTIKVIGSRDDEKEIANKLFEILRAFDKEEVDLIFSESFNERNLGQAIMNRLLKASGYQVINV
ncbi:L-threonylcarbamoyladenylate synthase [Natranaerovirga hydrolytica]|uniref:Threonylcarbamoyl-AMP synthase n=1 Tax=Natranaerovirga hydrolytica TaxID=680378 RepID=A0A4R1M7L0_9FIRM|nr:L-threonylcarbamoyladenylate synthase [Natranaerovirga hydrolytica]TCK87915.1 L-threonylcarbamoyladenylate synthase [Natranaerovirga hydrolytica]